MSWEEARVSAIHAVSQEAILEVVETQEVGQVAPLGEAIWVESREATLEVVGTREVGQAVSLEEAIWVESREVTLEVVGTAVVDREEISRFHRRIGVL
jgi:hypothetical protein